MDSSCILIMFSFEMMQLMHQIFYLCLLQLHINQMWCINTVPIERIKMRFAKRKLIVRIIQSVAADSHNINHDN